MIKRILKRGSLFFILFLVLVSNPLMANHGTYETSGSLMIFIILSLFFIVLLFFMWVLYRRRKRKFAQLVSDLELKIEKTEKSIEEIKQHSEEIVSRKRKMLIQDKEDLKKNLKSMQSALDSAHESARRNSVLLSNISHTLRTNLNDILGFSYLLGNDFAKNESTELYEFSENIRKSGDSLMHLLNNIIDISRIEANTFNLGLQNCDMYALMDELKGEFEPVAKQKGLQVFFQNEDVPLFSADVEALKHILTNLLDNAIKYTDSGFIKVIHWAESERINVSVKDTGIGIDKVYQDEIFEPFRRQSLGYSKTTYQGAGLGLPLVKQMLGLMGGTVVLESEKANGTTITISIPLSKPISENLSPGGLKSTVDEKKKDVQLKHGVNKVLVIDNDKLNNMLIKKMLVKVPNLIFVTNIKELNKIIENNGKSLEPFDIVILNIDFMKENGGVSLKQELQKSNPVFKKTPFVALSNIEDIGLDEKMIKAGFKTYIDKPINKEKLFNTMNTSIN
ncbi:MAG: response regulator [Bacteroidales bacterium]|nr:response regulator [Bacteroidales bacterium]